MLRAASAAAAALAPYAGLLDSLAGMTWGSQSRARAGDPGAHRSTRLGRSPEFTEYRAYRPGDDLRRLDWKLYGRTDRLFLRIADDHASLRTAVVVDASASMRFPVDGYGKWEHACAIALGLTAIAIGEGDPVGIVVAAQGGDRSIPARRRRDLLPDAAATFQSVEVHGDASVSGALSRMAAEPRLVVITDFLGDTERVLRELRVAAAAGSEVFAVHVAAAEELAPPERTFMAADPERPSFQRALSHANRRQYLDAFASWREGIAAELHAMNANYVLTSTGEPVRDAVRRIVSSTV
jgi:uncharacterized protein (DUF58 family)